MKANIESNVVRVAMWSGPRNISTAMMRSWENRPDTAVVDEPFYAAFLNQSGIVHPMRDEILASQSSDWAKVISDELQKDLELSETIQYQKHMTQHMTAKLDNTWFASLRHAFLIRNPDEVVASYGAKREQVTANDVGFARQHELFENAVIINGKVPPVIDAKDVLLNPKLALQKLCEALDIPFHHQMLSWPTGTRKSDGVWAHHWYQNVEQSTCFAPYKEKDINLTKDQKYAADESKPFYQEMYKHRIVLE